MTFSAFSAYQMTTSPKMQQNCNKKLTSYFVQKGASATFALQQNQEPTYLWIFST